MFKIRTCPVKTNHSNFNYLSNAEVGFPWGKKIEPETFTIQEASLVPAHVVSVCGAKQFLAAMSSSRSDVVTQFIRPSVLPFFRPLFFLLVFLEFYLVLKGFNGV